MVRVLRVHGIQRTMVVCGLPILPMCIFPRRAIVTAAKVPSAMSARTAYIGRSRSTTTSTVTASDSIRANGSGTALIVIPVALCGLSSKNNMTHDYMFVGSLRLLTIGDPIFCIIIVLLDAVDPFPFVPAI